VIRSNPGASEPKATLRVRTPILAAGANYRNLERCVLSGGYLAFMLWIVLMAANLAFHRQANSGWALSRLAFLACLAVLFAVVGNRRLIRDSFHFAYCSRLERSTTPFDLARSSH
jgi:hypothetical protein